MAQIGPFNTFAFSGVYTETVNEAPSTVNSGSLRFPAFIGIGDEVTAVNGYEMIRGSSAMADNYIPYEDVSSQVTGSNRNFTVTFKPITTGAGTGTVATDPNSVKAFVNGNPSAVASIDAANGIVYLMSFPSVGDTVTIAYYFKRKDTFISNEDLSIQADGTNVTFKVQNVPIVDGSNGGITTTDPTLVTVTVNSATVSVSAVDGASGQITLAAAPVLGSTVLVTYYTNEYQYTYDILPSNTVNSITNVGYNATSTNFIQGTDYVLDSTGTFNTINWGNSAKVSNGTHVAGSVYLSSVVSDSLYDNKFYRQEATGTVDGTNKTFSLAYAPTVGNGLGQATDDISLVTVYFGTNPTDATVATVKEMSSINQTVTLTAAPIVGQNVYVTQYLNKLADDSWTLSDTTEGAVGVGAYTISGLNGGVAYGVAQDASAGGTHVVNVNFPANISYPDGLGAINCDAMVVPGHGITETVYFTFLDASHSTRFAVTSSVANGTGSAGDNTGYLNQTYVDNKTGFSVTILQATTGSIVYYQGGDVIAYSVSPTIVTSAVGTRAIPGLKTTVANTTGIVVGETALINTHNNKGSEPNVGDFYYVSFLNNKEFINGAVAPTFVYLENDALAYSGTLTINNRLGLAAHLAFLNGAPAVALTQIQRTAGGSDAPDQYYMNAIDVFNTPMSNGLLPSLMEPVTTSQPVLSYLKTSNTKQSSERYANERTSFFGFANNTTPTQAMSFATTMAYERMQGIYPDGGIVTITDALGNAVEYIVDGSLLAAAYSGRDTSPAYDVAEPMTRKPIVGFTRLFRTLDSVTQGQVCSAGLTLLEATTSGIDIKMDLTTDVSTVLTRTPSVIKIKDSIQQGTRRVLGPYIGKKNLNTMTSQITTTLTSYLSSQVQANIIKAFTGVKATVDPNDPTTINVVAYYAPIFPLLYICVTFNLRSSL
jgi:hypothetical protein